MVSAGPLARPVSDFATPVTSLDAEAIRRKSAGTLGQMLDSELGVTASGFGAGSSRPIIRGFDGPRVRILDSGIEAIDVSDTSPDHAVSVEPLLVERVEVLRGPSTLLYGSSAIGGVVNVIGREIPRELADPKGYNGAVETRYDSASRGFTSLGFATVGGDQWAVNVTGLTREAKEYDIPGDAELHSGEHHEEDDHDHDEDHSEEEGGSGRLDNSFVETDAFSIGGTWFWNDSNYLGMSFSSYESLYGIAGHSHGHEDDHDEGDHESHEEEAVSIDLKRLRYDLEWVLIEPFDWAEAVRLRLGYTDYEHTELEGSEVGTVFEREGWELRGEVAHAPISIFDSGIVGFQFSDTDFSAEGDEAFTPSATTRNQAVFISEHIHGEQLHWEFGARLEAQSIDPESPESSYSGTAVSLAASAIWEFSDHQSIAVSLQRSQRHPTSTELFADGTHLATEQFEIGNAGLDLETAYGLDVVYRYTAADWNGSLSVFYTHFDDFIFADETGEERQELPVFEFTAVDANFWGVEGELERVMFSDATQALSMRVFFDYVRATNEEADDSLPRIPPLRVGVGADWSRGNWDAGVTLRRTMNQGRTAGEETDTDGFTELTLNLSREFELGNGLALTVFGRADNVLDEEIRYHTSFLKDVAPLPGRSLTIGARLEF
jgi:iron complex outermembrane receptor protein